MTGAASIAAVLLAAVFGWAAVAKVARRTRTVAAFAALGLPAPALLAVAVPAAELFVAGLLVLRPDIGAAVALAALAALTLVVVRALSSGSRAGCGCFGSRRVEPVSSADIFRNGCLAALAALATGTARLVRPGVGPAVAMAVVVAAGVGGLAAARRLLAHMPDPAVPSSPAPAPAAARLPAQSPSPPPARPTPLDPEGPPPPGSPLAAGVARAGHARAGHTGPGRTMRRRQRA